MNLLPTLEQAEITAVIGDFLANEVPARRYQVDANLGAAYPQSLWMQFVELGWIGVSCAEGIGGSALGMAEEILLAREAGRQLVSPTVLSTGLAAAITGRHGLEELARPMIAGDARVALALKSGSSCLVIDGDTARYALLCAGGKAGLYEMAGASETERVRSTDESVSVDRVAFTAEPVFESTDEADVLHVAIILCAALSGIAEAARDGAVTYAKEREQFGQAIGAFQSISHLCADMAVSSEAAWCQVVFAALSLQAGQDKSREQVAAAADISARAAIDNARANVQVHGGVGFTVEYDAHLLVKRSHVLSELLNAALDPQAVLLAKAG